MINLIKLILLISISIVNIQVYSANSDIVKANEKQMLEMIEKVKEVSIPALVEALNNYQDNSFMSKSFMEMMLQQTENFVNTPSSTISKIAFEQEKEVDDFSNMGEVPVVSSKLCAPDYLEYAPPFILSICAQYNKSGKTTEYNTSGEVLWCVVEGQYYIPEHCKNTQCSMQKLSSVDIPMPPPNSCPNEALVAYENRVAQALAIGGEFDMAEMSRRVDCHYGQKLLDNNSLSNIDSWMEAILEMGGGDGEKVNQLNNLYNKSYLLPMACALRKCTNAAECNSIQNKTLEYLFSNELANDLEFLDKVGVDGAQYLADFVIKHFQ